MRGSRARHYRITRAAPCSTPTQRRKLRPAMSARSSSVRGRVASAASPFSVSLIWKSPARGRRARSQHLVQAEVAAVEHAVRADTTQVRHQRVGRDVAVDHLGQAQREVTADVRVLAGDLEEFGVGALPEMVAVTDVREDQPQLREVGERLGAVHRAVQARGPLGADHLQRDLACLQVIVEWPQAAVVGQDAAVGELRLHPLGATPDLVLDLGEHRALVHHHRVDADEAADIAVLQRHLQCPLVVVADAPRDPLPELCVGERAICRIVGQRELPVAVVHSGPGEHQYVHVAHPGAFHHRLHLLRRAGDRRVGRAAARGAAIQEVVVQLLRMRHGALHVDVRVDHLDRAGEIQDVHLTALP